MLSFLIRIGSPVLLGAIGFGVFGAPAGEAPRSAQAVILVVQGTVEVAAAGSTNWVAARQGQTLDRGDQLRTGARSRAEVRLTDLSVLPVRESTRLTIDPPSEEDDRPVLNLGRGSIFFHSRERRGGLRFRTRLASGAIRGTEFHLQAEEDGTTKVALFDGAIDLMMDQTELTLGEGEEVLIEPDRPPVKSSVLNAVNIIQWVLYYPAVLDLAELELPRVAREQIEESLAAYLRGNVVEALERYPVGREPASDAEHVYLAATLLAVGQVEEAESHLNGLAADSGERLNALANAVRRLIAAVQLAPWVHEAVPSTASGWLAQSYAEQSQGDLENALTCARRSVALSPGFGFAWVRLGELEFSFGRARQASDALERGLELSSENAQAWVLRGFVAAAEDRLKEATEYFERALDLDAALGGAWLGRGLVRIRRGEVEAGRRDLQTAVSLEPQRGIFRSYFGKALGHQGEAGLAERELARAMELDPSDPTAWLYSALLHRRQNRVNEAVRHLEKSQELNDNRRLFRSTLLLDQDRAVRSANLANIYRDAGMSDVSVREAVRAISYDYANYSAHLFLADSYEALRDPRQIDLRYETPTVTEYLVANLLAPVGVGTLSQYISPNEYSRLFERDGLGVSSRTEYFSNGDWFQSGAQFGTLGNTSYALESVYRWENGYRANNELEQLLLSAKVQQQLTPRDKLYLQVLYQDFEAGDVSRYYNEDSLRPHLTVNEYQEPILLAGYHHEWAPGSHTLFLTGHARDRFLVDDRSQPLLLLGRDAAGRVVATPRGTFPLADMEYRSEFELSAFELQQIWQRPRHTLIGGGRFQTGDFDTETALKRSSPTRLGTAAGNLPFPFATPAIQQDQSTPFERYSLYGYYHWAVADPLLLVAGLAYDAMAFPENHRQVPISDETEREDQWSPKAGLIWTPWKDTTIRAGYSRSLGGVSFDQSIRLEPTQVAGFNHSYRSIISESVVGSVAAPAFDVFGIAWDQEFGAGTYLGLEAEWLRSEVDRSLGVFYVGGIPPAFSTGGIAQELDYDERSLTLSVNQLVGNGWSMGGRYRLSYAELENRTPAIPTRLSPGARTDEEAILHQVRLYALYNHQSGWFALAESDWYQQSNRGYEPDIPGDDFWQFNAFAGYRFWDRRAELRLGVLNITDQDFNLNPLNFYLEPRHDRTFTVSFRFYFP